MLSVKYMKVLNLSAIGHLARAWECPLWRALLNPIQVIGVGRGMQCIAHSHKILFVSRSQILFRILNLPVNIGISFLKEIGNDLK